VLTGYVADEEIPEELKKEQPEGKSYNPYFASGHWIGMPTNGTLTEDGITYDDGTKASVDQMARDVAAFLAWTAEPKMEERKRLGFSVMIFLGVFSVMLYLVKKKIWARAH
jgi:ubiquinol-cytochrome c reductase cytochrome c1 subunit